MNQVPLKPELELRPDFHSNYTIFSLLVKNTLQKISKLDQDKNQPQANFWYQ